MLIVCCVCLSITVVKCGKYCSLFEVVSKSKPGNQNLAGLLQKLERDKIVRHKFFTRKKTAVTYVSCRCVEF